ncbi:hypothetical protein PsYK624_092990 [Phanerochaete sordida]|uniref:Uncharacterized protein n=1 Tax=Phanerochaete sordida TaxID=48140 RepID=A0A9P3GE52_9APHY|nr:hypothetical protein PsYK624_092990 [Phanerochaete sordida]
MYLGRHGVVAAVQKTIVAHEPRLDVGQIVSAGRWLLEKCPCTGVGEQIALTDTLGLATISPLYVFHQPRAMQ